MSQQRVAKVTISLPMGLLEYADQLAKENSTTRSAVIARLLEKEEEGRVRELMAEGYREMAEENRRDAEAALNLTSEVMLRNEGP
jgi:metal-responsive CopG/Arc/MetJ family transcriptional regulator